MKTLLPTVFSPQGDWRQTFYDVETGEAFFCSCFRQAIKNASHLFSVSHPHVKYALENDSYLPGICHLCTKTTPPIKCDIDQKTFSFKRTYGAYIFKVKYQKHKAIPFKKAENIVRGIVGYPLVGEGWVSEALLYYLIKTKYPEIEVIQHGTPAFLESQHFDVWIPELKIAVEFQGEQHKRPVEYFGGEAAFADRQERDNRKRKLSAGNGVTLFAIDGRNYHALLDKIEAAIQRRL